jgi:rhodanese-related sulfurtransferase
LVIVSPIDQTPFSRRQDARTMVNHITPAELAEKQSSGDSIAIIDVRTPVEFREVHVPHAINLPLDRVSVDAVRQLADNTPVYIICKSGQRSNMACEKLANDPLIHVELVDGGTDGWIEAGQEVVRGKAAIMSLERQVRLTAGSFVFIGTMLGYFVYPGWLCLSGFVGAGLVFAALTDTCGMGMVLSRMPWNQVGHT